MAHSSTSRKDQVDDEDESARKEEVISDVLTSHVAIAFLSLLITVLLFSLYLSLQQALLLYQDCMF